MQYYYEEKDRIKSMRKKTDINNKHHGDPTSKNTPQMVPDRYMLEKMKEEEIRLRAQMAYGWNGYLGWY